MESVGMIDNRWFEVRYMEMYMIYAKSVICVNVRELILNLKLIGKPHEPKFLFWPFRVSVFHILSITCVCQVKTTLILAAFDHSP